MTETPVNIIEFIEHPELINDRSLSKAQKAILKSTYGLPLDPQEFEIYQHATGRETYDPSEQREVTIIAGRRSGKTSKIAAMIACFEAFRDHGLPPGEEACVMLLAPQIAQARIAFRYIRNYIRGSRILSKRVVSMTKDEIKLDNGIIIGCYACTYDGVRGRSIVTAISDELAFWSDGETSANPAEEVIAAVLPGMITVQNAKLVKISTPHDKQGILWREFQQRAELDFPVWRLSTQEMNPTIRSSMLEKERRRSEEKYRREFLAEFTDNIAGWIAPEVLEACVVRGRKDLPRVETGTYVAAVDPGFKRSDFAMAIVHRDRNEMFVVDRLARWTGTKQTPVPFEHVCEKIKNMLAEYRLNCAVGDQFCSSILKQHFDKLGISYKEVAFRRETRATLFIHLRHLLQQQKIELLDDAELLRQLRSLEERKTSDGNIDIRAPYQQKDDLGIVVGLAALELSNCSSSSSGPLPIIFDRIPRPWDGYLSSVHGYRADPEGFAGWAVGPEGCPLAAICKNFPRCLDEGSCQGFKDERVS